MADTAYPTTVPDDVRDEDNFAKPQTDMDLQWSFVRKVLGIVGGQFTLTFVMCLASSYNVAFGLAMQNIWCLVLALVLMIGCLIPLCCAGPRRSVPFNYGLLLGFTFGESIFIAACTADLTPESVLTSIGVFAVLLSTLWVTACAAKDSAALLVTLIIGACIAVVLQVSICIAMWCTGYLYGSMVGYATLGLVAAAIFVIIDLVMVMIPGEISKDDYILASLMLYIDLIRMFLYILMLFGKRK